MATRTETRLGYVPHFDVTTVDGEGVRYQDLWQRRNNEIQKAGNRHRHGHKRADEILVERLNSLA
jgi:hypothetical protein